MDVEANGPVPGLYSMVSLGAVDFKTFKENPATAKTFYTTFRPINMACVPEALAVSGFTYDECIEFQPALKGMQKFEQWLVDLAGDERIQFVADNAGFDWQFVNYYFHAFIGSNPFGFSPMSMTSLYKGAEKSMFANFKKLRRTKHTHNALDDARGNAEALFAIKDIHGIKGL